MTPHETFFTCMNALADSLELELPERAESDSVVLSIDGTEVTFSEDADGQWVVITAEIGEIPPDSKSIFSSLALQANYALLGGTALSLDAESGDLFATTALPLALADPDALSRAVEALVDTAEEWNRNATAFSDVDEEAALVEAENAEANPLSGNPGFLRV